MNDDERIEKLARSIHDRWHAVGTPGPTGRFGGGGGDAIVAKLILDDPQAHIDALVEAGVLAPAFVSMPTSNGQISGQGYRVVQPKHEHDWRVHSTGPGTVTLHCRGCIESRSVPNQLPIVVP
jgi:hypothetical protein